MRKREHIHGFVEVMWNWFQEHKRSLPWRDLSIEDDNQRAYQILISEIMLQQTQVSRVKVMYKQFLEQFPSLDALAKASNKEVILAWRGMGYNSRALRLRDTAKAIVHDFDGIFPRSMEDLESLPGVGHYTAAAIRNFAFDLPTPCLDTNIRRILHRSFVGPENPDGSWKKDDTYLLKLAEEVLEVALDQSKNSQLSAVNCQLSASHWHACLMDFGSLVCTKRNPKWNICPLTKKGLMKAAYKLPTTNYKLSTSKQEPGRYVGPRFIPNRIFRGKVIEELRDEPQGLKLTEIGRRICIDWSPLEHRRWLSTILKKLEADQLIEKKSSLFVLAD